MKIFLDFLALKINFYNYWFLIDNYFNQRDHQNLRLLPLQRVLLSSWYLFCSEIKLLKCSFINIIWIGNSNLIFRKWGYSFANSFCIFSERNFIRKGSWLSFCLPASYKRESLDGCFIKICAWRRMTIECECFITNGNGDLVLHITSTWKRRKKKSDGY